LIAEERKKRHPRVAEELEAALREPVPRLAKDRGSNLAPDATAPLWEVCEPKHSLADMVLEPVVSRALEHLLQDRRQARDLTKGHIEAPRLVLFCGPPGCGKTMAAECVANELRMPLLRAALPAVIAANGEQTVVNLRAVIEQVLDGPYVVLFDEFDMIASVRGDQCPSREMKRVLSCFWRLAEELKDSMLIAATNAEQALDATVWSRFHEIVRFDRPREGQLTAMVRHALKPLRFQTSQVDEIARNLMGVSYLDVERVCQDVRKSCLLRGASEVATTDVREAIARRHYRQSILQKVARGVAAPAEQQ
jgi:SpoVK/Ycf46/Vps4 family AAA+-type ATPase